MRRRHHVQRTPKACSKTPRPVTAQFVVAAGGIGLSPGHWQVQAREMMPSSPVVIALAVEVKNLFVISAAALVIRMRDLDIIGETAVQNVFRGVGRTWRTEEPCPLDRAEEPRRFQRLCFRALAKNIVSKSKAAELQDPGERC